MGSKAQKAKGNNKVKTHRSVLRSITPEQHAYLLDMMRKAAKLRNEAIYQKAWTYAERGYYPSYETIYEDISKTPEYQALPTDIAQATLKQLDANYDSTFEKWKGGDRHANVPRQKDPKLPITIAFTNRTALRKGRDHILVPGKQTKKPKHETKTEAEERKERAKRDKGLRSLPIPADINPDDYASVTEVKLVPKEGGNLIELQLVTKVATEARRPKTIGEATRVMTVDPGLDNLMTCTAFETAEGEEGVLGTRIYDGRELKSRNESFNGRIADINREIERLRDERPYRWKRRVNRHYDAIRHAYAKRDRMLDWLARSCAARLVKWATSMGVEFVAFSWNDGFKTTLGMGRNSNRKFSQVPLARFRDAVRDACAKAGIGFGTFEESYTSRASSLVPDPMPVFSDLTEEERKRVCFSGSRPKRGLYVVVIDGCRYELNADVNATLNQLDKCKPGSLVRLLGVLGRDGLLAAVSRPKRERLLNEGYARTGKVRRTNRVASTPKATNGQSAGTTLNQKPRIQSRAPARIKTG